MTMGARTGTATSGSGGEVMERSAPPPPPPMPEASMEGGPTAVVSEAMTEPRTAGAPPACREEVHWGHSVLTEEAGWLAER